MGCSVEENGVKINFINTCPIDNFLYMLHLCFETDIDFKNKLQKCNDDSFSCLLKCLKLCENQEFSKAEFLWAKYIHLKPDINNTINFYGDLDARFCSFFVDSFKTYSESTCDNSDCPMKSDTYLGCLWNWNGLLSN